MSRAASPAPTAGRRPAGNSRGSGFLPTLRWAAGRAIFALDSVRDGGPEFLGLWLRVRNSVPGWLSAAEAYLLYTAARRGPGAGAVVEIGSAWGRSTIFLARGTKHAARERVYAIDPHDLATVSPTHGEGAWWPPRRRLPLLTGREPWYLREDHSRSTGSLTGFLANLRRFGVEGWVIPVVSTSTEAARSLDTGPIRLLFVDGLHSYEGVRADIRDWVPRVVRGGVLVFDDYESNHPAYGVRRAVDELLASGAVDPTPRPVGKAVWTIKL
jgi:predicted O-methyltransferase YrrM